MEFVKLPTMSPKRIAVVASLLFASVLAFAQEKQFDADPRLAESARGWGEEFVAFAQAQYKTELDWSEVSIKYLDEIVDGLHETYVKEKPPESEIMPLSRALGSYVAEVYRIRHGGTWGWFSDEAGSYPGVKTQSGAEIYPLAKALDRLKTGNSPDIWEYFQMLKSY